jgi:hypothetical protein
MTLTAVLRADSAAVLPGDLGHSLPVTYMEAEQIIPVRELPLPLVWICADDHDAVERRLTTSDAVARAVPTEHHDDHRLYWIEWHERAPLLACLTAIDAAVVAAIGDDNRWRVTLRCRPDTLEQLYRQCRDSDIDVTIDRLADDATISGYPADLSHEQYEIIALACECGYFDVPRRCTLGDLATELDLSDQAASTRLRRGLRAFLTHQLPWG